MGGWISLSGQLTDLKERAKRFKNVFDIENVPNLNMNINQNTKEFATILWAWKKGNVPDVYLYYDEEGDVLLFCGVITTLTDSTFEIYNNRMIVKDLLSLWKSHGDSVIKKINGSWSLLFYQTKDKTITLFTDRFASRSIWISRDKNTWVIGNFPSSIVTLRNDKTTLDPAGLWSLFQTARHIPGKSLYKEVFSLTAGQKAILKSNGKFNITNWLYRRYKANNHLTAKDWGCALSQALRCSGDRLKRITPDMRLFLSGGIDSRIVAAAYGNSLKTITLCNSPNFESRIARSVAKNLKLEHKTIVRSPYWDLNSLNASALISSGNYFIKHTHFIMPVLDIVKNYNDASFILGDPIENLNKHYFDKNKIDRCDISNMPRTLLRSIPQVSPIPSRISKIFNSNLRKILHDSWFDCIKKSYSSVMSVSEDMSDRLDTYLRWIDVSVTYTYNMITCIWPFASERNLFYDNDLDDLSLQIPANVRGQQILHRWILWFLKKTLLIIPDSNHFLPIIIPKQIQNIALSLRPYLGNFRRNIYRRFKYSSHKLPTSGSWLLRSYLYRDDKNYRKLIGEYLRDKDAFPADIFNREEITEIWNAFLGGDSSMLYYINALLSFGVLHRFVPTHGV